MENQFREIAALIGEQVRASVMLALMDGRALTATELAVSTDSSPQNISNHLGKLVQAGLLVVENQSRHRYYRFSRQEVAYAIEALAALTSETKSRGEKSTEVEPGIKYCRSCYDHLAGKVGVQITDSLIRQKLIRKKNMDFEVTNKGKRWFANLGIDFVPLQTLRRSFLRPCLDWSERRYHMAGSLACALLEKMISEDWLRKTRNSRALIVTAKGQKYLKEFFLIEIANR